MTADTRAGAEADPAPGKQMRGDAELERRICDEVRARLRVRVPTEGGWTADEVRGALDRALLLLAPRHPDAGELARRLLRDLVGLGPLDELLAEPDVQEVMVNGPDAIFVEIGGRIRRHERGFRDEGHLKAVLERMLAMAGQAVHERRPFAEGTLPDGSRFHVVVPPMAARGALLTIRRFPSRMLAMEELTGQCRAMPRALAEFLALAVRNRATLVISGAAGAGKTTLLNALGASIPRHERVVSLETTPELRLELPNWAALACARPGPDGLGGVDLRELLRNALRMRPGRMLVGECLGAEAFDLIQALNTGHPGSMTTIHASSPWDALERIVTLAISSGAAVPAAALWRQVAAGIELIVQLVRLPDGTRRVGSLARVKRGDDGTAVVCELASMKVVAGDVEAAEPSRAAHESGPDGELSVSWEVQAGHGDLPASWPAPERAAAMRLLQQCAVDDVGPCQQ